MQVFDISRKHLIASFEKKLELIPNTVYFYESNMHVHKFEYKQDSSKHSATLIDMGLVGCGAIDSKN